MESGSQPRQARQELERLDRQGLDRPLDSVLDPPRDSSARGTRGRTAAQLDSHEPGPRRAQAYGSVITCA